MAVIVPQGHGRSGSSLPEGGNAGTRPNNSKTGGGTPRATTRLWSPGGPKGPPRPAAGSVPVMGGRAASPLDGADVVTIIRTMMGAQSAANVAMSAAYNVNMIAFHTAMAQALVAKNGDKDSKLTVAKKKTSKHAVGMLTRTLSQPRGCTWTWTWKGELRRHLDESSDDG